MQKFYPKVKLTFTLILTIFLSVKVVACSDRQPSNNSDLPTNTDTVVETIQPQLTGEPRALSPDFMCFNVNSIQVQSWTKPEFVNSVNNLSPATLRIPGGDVGNYWDWQRGGLIQDISSLPDGLPFFLRFKARQYTASQLPNYKAGLEATETKPIFVLNMLTSNLQSQLKMLQTAKDLGMPVEYVELGNEFYFNIPNYKQVFPTPKEYALQASQWIAAVKQQFPEAKISLVGVVPPPEKPDRLQNWNQTLLEAALPASEAITIHIYNSHGLDAKAPASESYPFFNDAEVATILGEPFRNWQKLQSDRNYKIIPPDKKIWITEYNLFGDIFQNGSNKPQPRVAGSWAHGLYNMAMSLLFLEEPRIELICNHSLIEGSIFGAVLANKNSFVNPINENEITEPFSLSATGSALSLLGEASKDMQFASQIDLSGTTTLTGKDGFNYPALYGWMFSNSNKQGQSIIMNLSDRQQEIDLSSLYNSTVEYQQVAGSPQTLVTKSGVLKETNGEATDKIMLPAYSVTKLSGKLP
ncbi:MAG: hypothetical protein Tsb0014_11310 [Pleurocapsa sp.]